MKRTLAYAAVTKDEAQHSIWTFYGAIMLDFSGLGRILILIGLILAAVGCFMILAARLNLPWIGRLPGDFLFRGKNVAFYFPLTTSLIISIVLTLILWLINRR